MKVLALGGSGDMGRMAVISRQVKMRKLVRGWVGSLG